MSGRVKVTVEAVLVIDGGMEDPERVGNDLAQNLVIECKANKARVVERRVTCKE